MTMYGQAVPPPTSNSCIGEQGKIRWYYWNNVEGSAVDYIYAHDPFPQGPDGFLYLKETASGSNFNDFYGSKMKGYFVPPENGNYQFNLIANDRGNFYLSSDDNPANLNKEIELTNAISSNDFYDYPNQVSNLINLQADQYYYFEIDHKESSGSDYVRLYWNSPSMTDSMWQTIPVDRLYENVCDDICPAQGAPCDDGLSYTVNDREDGHCNCIGDQESALGCVDRQGTIRAMSWNNLPGSNYNDLYSMPTFPLIPDSIEFVQKYDHLGQYSERSDEYFGRVVKTYLSVPTTGEYFFNVTGDDRVALYLSSDEEVFNSVQIANSVNYNNVFEHDEHPTQTSAGVQLYAGQYYYMEVHHINASGGNRYHVYWKTPNGVDDNWKVIPTVYLHGYGCETACFPDGTSCDDNDTTTYNDQITNCGCAGTPCPGGDCTELESFFPYEACDYTENHSNTNNNSWLSCTTSENPNSSRGMSHWILYDFNAVYLLNNASIWNYNVAGNTGSGFKDFVVDYSIDGENWTTLGSYTMPEAPGTASYAGVITPDLSNIAAQYVLITALSTWDNGACAGISEISFDAASCPLAGTVCDDGDATTTEDMYNIYCECKGLAPAVNDCIIDTIIIDNSPALSRTYSAIQYLESERLVEDGSNVNFLAGNQVALLSGFEAKAGANFLADIESCSSAPIAPKVSVTNTNSTPVSTDKKQVLGDLTDYKFFTHFDHKNALVYIDFSKKRMKELTLRVNDFSGKTVLLENHFNLNDRFEKRLLFGDYPSGIYHISIKANDKWHTERMVVN